MQSPTKPPLLDEFLHVVQELVVVLLIDPTADGQHDNYIGQHEQMKVYRRNGGLNDDFPEIADEQINRV